MNRTRTQLLTPKFSVDLWNCFHSVLEDLPKTNNACEGFHHGFSAILGSSHPTIFKLIKGLQEQHTLTSLKINQFLAGTMPNVNKKYAALAKRLRLVVESYGADESELAIFSHTEYLRKIAYLISE